MPSFAAIIDQIDQTLLGAPPAPNGGSLLMMVGLPGSGKSSVVNALYSQIPFVTISSDNIRQQWKQHPTYAPDEMLQVYEIGYALIEQRLKKGQRVVFDASNLLQSRRDHVAQLAQRCGKPLAICYIQANQAVVDERLRQREQQQQREVDLSDADWFVYKWMVETQEPLVREHIVLDTTNASLSVLADKLFDYWKECEQIATSNPDLQSSRWASRLRASDGVFS